MTPRGSLGSGRSRGRAGSSALLAARPPAPPPPTQVMVALDAFKATPPANEADLAPVQTLINEAYKVRQGVGSVVWWRWYVCVCVWWWWWRRGGGGGTPCTFYCCFGI